MDARIVSLATANPPLRVNQDDIFTGFFADLYAGNPNAARLFASTTVRQRHVAWDAREAYVDGFPLMSTRMQGWQDTVLTLGKECLSGVLDGRDATDVGTFVMASCTGYAGPTPEILLARDFGLRRTVRRTFVGHMGCYAAFNAIKVALDALAARPDELALVLCAEVCSVHGRPEPTDEQVIVHALFGDAAAAVLLSADTARPGPVIVRTHTETHFETAHAMGWTIEDDAFRMSLSSSVPRFLARAIRPFVEELIAPAGLAIEDVRHWGIHPGGPKIVEFVGGRLGLPDEALVPSLGVLAEFGNCSSPTILLILDRILEVERPAPGEYGVLMAFGPGLTLESALVRF